MKTILYVGNYLKTENSAPTTIETLGNLLVAEGYTVFFTSSKKSKLLRLVDMILTFFRKVNSVDVIFIDTYSTSNFYYALIISQLARLFNKEYIPILHGGNLKQRLDNNSRLSKLIFNNAKCNVAPSKFMLSVFKEKGYENCVYIPNSIEINNYPNFSKDFESIRLLWVRSFSKIYNPKLAIDVLKGLKDKGLNAELCMVGPEKDGSLSETKAYAKELNVDVAFTGKLTKEEWITLSKNYNVFINTTNFDNMPVSVLEAMALGFPVVSTNVGGLPYMISNNTNGLLVEPKSSSDMIEAILKLNTDVNLRAKISDNARKYAKQFDWQIVKGFWFELIDK